MPREVKTVTISNLQIREPAPTALLPITWITIGHAIIDVYMNVIPPLQLFLAAALGLGRTEMGFILAVLSVTSSGLQPLFGYLVDRWGKNWLFSGSVVIAAVCAAAVGFVTNFHSLAIVAALGGLGSALYHPLGSVAVNRLGGERKGLAVSLYATGGHLGFSLAPIIVVSLVEAAGFPALGYILLPGLVVALVLHQNNSISLAAPGGQRVGLRGELRTRFIPLVLLNLIAFLRSWAQIAAVALVPWFLMELGWSQKAAQQMLSPFLLAGTLGGMVAGFLSDHCGRRSVILGSLLAAAASTVFFLNATSSLTLWASLLLLGACLNATVPVSVVLAQELIPHNSGMAAGMMLGLSFGLGGLGVTLTSYLSDLYGVGPALASTIPLLLAAALGTVFLKEEARPGICLNCQRKGEFAGREGKE